VSDESTAERRLHRAAKAITAARVIATCCALVVGASVSGAFWLGYSGPTYAKELIKSAISQDIAKINKGISELSDRVTALEPQPKIVDVDLTATQVISPCANGIECLATVRARRTNWGRSCRVQPGGTQALMVDSRGVTLPVEFRGARINLNHNYRIVEVGFSFDRAAPGDALVEISVSYKCPRGDVIELESEKVLSLEFEVVPTGSERLSR